VLLFFFQSYDAILVVEEEACCKVVSSSFDGKVLGTLETFKCQILERILT